MLTLGLSTSTPFGSVAVVRGAEVLAAESYEGLMQHAERLLSTVDAALAAAGVGRADIELLACDVGPGSFTGVRVAVASAKGMALGLGVPLVGVRSLEAMAFEARAAAGVDPDATLVPVLDAKKGEVYAAAFDASLALVAAPWHAPLDRFGEVVRRLSRPVVFGEGAEPLARAAGLIVLPGVATRGPAAVHVAQRGSALIASGRAAGDPGLVEPEYVRAPDATPPART